MYINNIAVDITNDCNLRCKHCYNESGDNGIVKNKMELTDEEWIRFFSGLDYDCIESICFCGGEPLLRMSLIERICEFIPDGIMKNMVSNGMLLDGKVAKKLKKLKFNLVQISIDGLENTHNYIRNHTNSFKSAINAIKSLRTQDIDIAVACLPTKMVLRELDELVNILNQNGVSSFKMQPFMNMGRGVKIFTEVSLTYSEEGKLIDKISEYRRSIPEMKFEWGDPSDHLFLYNNHHINFDIIPQVFISAAGEVGLTPYIPVSIGNIKINEISDILVDKKIQKYLQSNDFINCSNMLDESMNFAEISKKYNVFSGNNILINEEN